MRKISFESKGRTLTKKATHKKYTLKNRYKPTHEPKFLREYFFCHPKEKFLPTLL
jgi:hypothetical protein